MGCYLECKLFKDSDDKTQFNFPQKVNEKNASSENNNNNKGPESFDEKIKKLGDFTTEEDFENSIPEEAKQYIKEKPFPYKSEQHNSIKQNPVIFENGNIYYGEWNKNCEMEGYGKYYLKEEEVFVEGIWEKGELIKARILCPNGDRYEGEIKDSVYNGIGKLTTKDYEYDGHFEKGEKNGQGTLKFKDGTEYSGAFSNNNFNGTGYMKWKDNIEFQGTFKDNRIEGGGTLNDNKGEKYVGNFKNNLFNGEGTYTYENGDIYVGNFEDGIRKGKGSYTKKDGLYFDGYWDNDCPNGDGKIKTNNKGITVNYYNGRINHKPYDDNFADINFNFYNEPMHLKKKLPHLDNVELSSSQYRADISLSFLKD